MERLTGALSVAPYLPQKLEVAEFSAPHFAHRPTNAFPQRTQKLFRLDSRCRTLTSASPFAPPECHTIARIRNSMQAIGY
jgi:hypothetical protein